MYYYYYYYEFNNRLNLIICFNLWNAKLSYLCSGKSLYSEIFITNNQYTKETYWKTNTSPVLSSPFQSSKYNSQIMLTPSFLAAVRLTRQNHKSESLILFSRIFTSTSTWHSPFSFFSFFSFISQFSLFLERFFFKVIFEMKSNTNIETYKQQK